jgi:hypothetical protein
VPCGTVDVGDELLGEKPKKFISAPSRRIRLRWRPSINAKFEGRHMRGSSNGQSGGGVLGRVGRAPSASHGRWTRAGYTTQDESPLAVKGLSNSQPEAVPVAAMDKTGSSGARGIPGREDEGTLGMHRFHRRW